jgi:hypothetical protein
MEIINNRSHPDKEKLFEEAQRLFHQDNLIEAACLYSSLGISDFRV